MLTGAVLWDMAFVNSRGESSNQKVCLPGRDAKSD